MSKLRICMMVTYDLSTHGGGVKQHAVHLANALRRRGDHVTIVGPASKPLDEDDMVGFGGIANVPANGSDNQLAIFVSPLAVRRFFKSHQFDVMHIHEPLQPALSYYSVWSTPKVPHVATFHAYAENEGLALNWARRFFARLLLPRFQRAIAVSQPAARYAGVTWKRPLAIIPNGVPTKIFRPPAPAAPGAAERPLKLLYVGRLGDKRKGIRYMIEAYEALLALRVPVTLDIVGELGGASPPPALSGLTYHGSIDQAALVEAYRSCDVFVAPSTGQESFGIVLVEAMSSGRIVVCSDIEGYRQVATTEGSFLVPPSDAAALARTIQQVAALSAAERQRLGDVNLAHVAQFDWDTLADKVRAEYLAAMGAPAEAPRVVVAPMSAAPVVKNGTRPRPSDAV
jgi:phosphatidylinositol alpha-mannosyltransferase